MADVDMMSCSRCKKEFDCIRVPMLLSCCHTFCHLCVQLLPVAADSHITCPTCHRATIKGTATINRYVSQLRKVEKMAEAEKKNSTTTLQKLGKLQEKLENVGLDIDKMRNENRLLKLEMEFCSKWCSTCRKMGKSSCGKLNHLLVNIDEERKVFPCTNSLEEFIAQTKSKWDGILDKRKAIGDSLKKIEEHLNLVTEHEVNESSLVGSTSSQDIQAAAFTDKRTFVAKDKKMAKALSVSLTLDIQAAAFTDKRTFVAKDFYLSHRETWRTMTQLDYDGFYLHSYNIAKALKDRLSRARKFEWEHPFTGCDKLVVMGEGATPDCYTIKRIWLCVMGMGIEQNWHPEVNPLFSSAVGLDFAHQHPNLSRLYTRGMEYIFFMCPAEVAALSFFKAQKLNELGLNKDQKEQHIAWGNQLIPLIAQQYHGADWDPEKCGGKRSTTKKGGSSPAPLAFVDWFDQNKDSMREAFEALMKTQVGGGALRLRRGLKFMETFRS